MEVVAYDKLRKVIDDLFQSLLSRDEMRLKTLMKGDSIYLLHYRYHKINTKRG